MNWGVFFRRATGSLQSGRARAGGDWHADPPYDESVTSQELLESGVGPVTQVAIFEATEAPAPDAEAVAAWVGPAPERVWAA